MAGTSERIGLKALRIFHAIVDSGSATAAGRRYGLSQPAVSRLLSQLEGMVGFELFHRDKGRLIPTADALLLFEEVDLSLQSVERVESVIRDISDYRVGQLKLVAPPSFSEGVLPDIVASFLSRHPGVHLTINSRSIETTKTMIATRAVDAGFVKLPLDRPDLQAQTIVVSETVCVLPENHPLAAERQITPLLLKGVPLILLGLGRASRMQVDMAFSDIGCKPVVQIETHTVGSACALAARGLGIALVNELLARPALRTGLVTRPFVPKLTHEYAFVTSALTQPSRMAKEFFEISRDYFQCWGAGQAF